MTCGGSGRGGGDRTDFSDRNALFELVGAEQAAATEVARAHAGQKRKADDAAADDARATASGAAAGEATIVDDDDVVFVEPVPTPAPAKRVRTEL